MTPPQTGVPAQRRPAAPTLRQPVQLVTARLRERTRTAPGRLRLATLVLTALVLLLGAAVCWHAVGRSLATDRVVSHSEPLSEDATEIYRSLADADTTAAGNFLLAAGAKPADRQRYQDDLATASRLLTRAAARSDASSQAQASIAELNQLLPQYASLVATAGTYDRQGLPLGGAYLRHASGLMQKTMLPKAQQLVDAESRTLDSDYSDALGLPFLAAVLGLAALYLLVRCQITLARRTNRVFNPGLLGTTAAVLAMLGWLVAAGVAAQDGVGSSRDHGALPLRALDQARFSALKAHTAENLDLVARGATDQYAGDWLVATRTLAGAVTGDHRATGGAQLDQARADAPTAAEPALALARSDFAAWDARHRAADAANQAGDYDTALSTTIGQNADTSDAAFAALDLRLAGAATSEQAAFHSAVQGVGSWWDVLAGGAVVLAALGAAGVVVGLGRRLAEYR